MPILSVLYSGEKLNLLSHLIAWIPNFSYFVQVHSIFFMKNASMPSKIILTAMPASPNKSFFHCVTFRFLGWEILARNGPFVSWSLSVWGIFDYFKVLQPLFIIERKYV